MMENARVINRIGAGLLALSGLAAIGASIWYWSILPLVSWASFVLFLLVLGLIHAAIFGPLLLVLSWFLAGMPRGRAKESDR